MLNGVTQLVVTKIDVLNKLSTIQAVSAYEVEGQVVDRLPYDLCHTEISPVLTSFNGWQSSLEGVDSHASLPSEAKAYLTWIEDKLQLPVTMVSIGPGREQLLPVAG